MAEWDVELTARVNVGGENPLDWDKERGGRMEGTRSDRFSSSHAVTKLELTRWPRPCECPLNADTHTHSSTYFTILGVNTYIYIVSQIYKHTQTNIMWPKVRGHHNVCDCWTCHCCSSSFTQALHCILWLHYFQKGDSSTFLNPSTWICNFASIKTYIFL